MDGSARYEPIATPAPEPSRRPVPWPSRLLVVAAAIAAILAAGWLSLGFPYLVVATALVCLAVAGPLLAGNMGQFRRACFVVAAVLAVLAVVGLFFGLYLFVPSAALLVAAPFTEPLAASYPEGRVARRIAAGLLAAGLLVGSSTSVAFGVAVYRSYFAAPDAFVVSTSPEFEAIADSRLLDGTGSGIGFGADGVSERGMAAGKGPTLYVHFRKDLSTAGQQQLKEHLLQLPGVLEVHLCHRPCT